MAVPYDILESYIRKAFMGVSEREKTLGRDIMWYIWLNPDSRSLARTRWQPLSAISWQRRKTHTEKKNPYYHYLENETVVNHILAEFGLPEKGSHIINGHVPVRSKNGESPVKCGGKILVIDGGFSKAYQKETGIAGYTLNLQLLRPDPVCLRAL